MTKRRWFAIAFAILPLVGRADVSPEQGGPGTIDPATVAIHERIRYTLGESNEIHGAAALATDSSGNSYLGTIIRIPPSDNVPQPPPPLSIISKFSGEGTLLWSRERKVTSVTIPDAGQPGGYKTTYYEQWSTDDEQRVISSAEGNNPVSIVALGLDSQANLVAAFQEGSGQTTLIVKFDADGKFVWRHATPEQGNYDPALAPRSLIHALDVNPADGSVLLLVRNFNSGFNGATQTVLIKLDADGSRVFTAQFGLGTDGSTEFESSPTAVTRDGAGNIYLLTFENPDYNTTYGPDQVFNVIRKLSPAGDLLGRADFPVYPTYTAGSTNYSSDLWAQAKADAEGNLYIAGSHSRPRSGPFNGPDQGEANALLLKLAPDLSEVWRTVGPQAKGRYVDQPGAAVVALELTQGVITLGGFTTNTGVAAGQNDDHWEVARYRADDGQLIWHRLYQAPATDQSQGFNDILGAMKVDDEANVYAAGVVSVPTGGVRQALIKYSAAGDLQFVKLFSDAYLGLQVATLSLPSATQRPTFFGTDQFNNKEVVVIDLDNPAVVAGPPEVLGNISTRVRVGTGDSVLIGGFIVIGPDGATKKVLIRAIGPSLLVAGALQDTTLELHDNHGHVITNDDWKQSEDPSVSDAEQQAAVEASTIPPTNDKEAALVATLSTGPVTAIVGGKGASGVALVEVYDLDRSAGVQLANISTRGKVEAEEENVMIGGVIILGNDPSTVLVRAIGPSLPVSGTLQDPMLELRDVNGSLVASNDDWKVVDGSDPAESQRSEIEATTIPPSDERESALIAILPPANYTAIVRGKDNSTGVALVEMYRLR